MFSLVGQLHHCFPPPPPLGIGRIHRIMEDDRPRQQDRLQEIEQVIADGASSLRAITKALSYHSKRDDLAADIAVLTNRGTVLAARNGRAARYFLAVRFTRTQPTVRAA